MYSSEEVASWVKLLNNNFYCIKYFPVWHLLRKESGNTLARRIPWITFEAKDWLDSYLKKEMRVFEWGSGGSTLYFSDKVNDLISIEHDPSWFKSVKRKLKKQQTKKYHLILPEKGANKKFTSSTFKGSNFKKYCQTIKATGQFDLVSVDGRARVGCVREALKHVKKGGHLLLDNSDRTEEYKVALDLLKNWKVKHFFGPGPYNSYFWRTSIFEKL